MQRSLLNTHRSCAAFTLLELLVVSGILALLAGLATISAATFIQIANERTTYGDCNSIGKSLSFAENDIGFIPRIHTLDLAQEDLIVSLVSGTQTYSYARPGMDTYGMLGQDDAMTAAVATNWVSSYGAISKSRQNVSSGRKGIADVRLPEGDYDTFANAIGQDITLVKWPLDPWNNPYIVYEVTVDRTIVDTSNPRGLRLIDDPSEHGDFFTAVVSYGPNHVPGGKKDTNLSQALELSRTAAMLCAEGDAAGGDAMYTMRSMSDGLDYQNQPVDVQGATLVLNLSLQSDQFTGSLPGSLLSDDPVDEPGILDKGCDDIFWEF